MQHVEASVPNQGARLLRKKMTDEGLSQGEIARRVGVGVDVVGRWLKETHRPRGDFAAKLQATCQIPAPAWWQEPSKDASIDSPSGKVA